jgi:AhpD family alkylhydroperoxidase
MAASDKQINAFDLDTKLWELVKINTAQINGCGYSHTKDALKPGETTQRPLLVPGGKFLFLLKMKKLV